MEDQDKAVLVEMVKEYSIQDVVQNLKEAIASRIDELVDLELNDNAREMSLVAWHLNLLK